MQFSFEIKIGETKFTITETADNHKEFIDKAAFFTSLPSKGPNGETDLRLAKRKTVKGDYYSIVSDLAGKEFKLGQSKDMKTLYAKGWEDKYNTNQDQDDDNSYNAPAPQAAKQTIVGNNNTQVASAPAPAAPLPRPAAAAPLPRMNPLPKAPTPAAAPVSNALPPVAAPLPETNNTAMNAVLAKYGIKK